MFDENYLYQNKHQKLRDAFHRFLDNKNPPNFKRLKEEWVNSDQSIFFTNNDPFLTQVGREIAAFNSSTTNPISKRPLPNFPPFEAHDVDLQTADRVSSLAFNCELKSRAIYEHLKGETASLKHTFQIVS